MIIIGGGSAGLTAGVFAAMLKIDAFFIAMDIGGQAIDSTKIQNYMGFDFITGPELVEKFNSQLIQSNYIQHLVEVVQRIEKTDDEFKVTTSDLDKYYVRAIRIATGISRRQLSVLGEEAF